MLTLISNVTTRFPKTILSVWILIVALTIPLASSLQEKLLSSGLEIEGSESYQATQTINNSFENNSEENVSIIVSSSSAAAINNEELNRFIKRINENDSVKSIEQAEVKNKVHLTVGLSESGNAFVAELREITQDFKSLDILITGSAALSYDIGEVSKDNVKLVERIGLPIVFILLLFVFRSVVSAILPIIVGLFSILISSAILSIIARNIDMSPLLSNVVTMLGLGIAIDYALFITRRFNGELEAGKSKEEAITLAIKTSGNSVLYAGLTVALTLLALLVPNTLITNSVALGGFVVVLTSVVVSLSLLPALLYLLGNKVNLLRIRFRKKQTSSYWEKFVHSIFKRPLVFLIVGIVLVSGFIPFSKEISMHTPVGAFQELPEETESRVGMEILAEEYGVGNIFPIEILIENKKDRFLLTDKSLESIHQLTQELENLDNVEKVHSITNWNNQFSSIEQYKQFYQNNMIAKLPQDGQEQLARILTDNQKYTIIRVVPSTVPYSENSRLLVAEIREKIIPQYKDTFTVSVTGETANGLDIDKKIIDSIPTIIVLILVVTYILLMIAFKSIVLPLKAILLNMLVTASSVGFIVFMFQLGHLPGTSPSPININTPLIMFALLFGLSIDYEVIIISRIKEYYSETKKLTESILEGFKETAGMINGAASIMIVVFGVFVFAHFQIIRELGTSLAYAILIDVLIVRIVLVPSTMYLLGKWNWYWPFFNSGKQKAVNDNSNSTSSLK